MFLDGLDELDQKIVSLLIQNARMSYSEIGQQIGISRVAVKMRVQALEQKKRHYEGVLQRELDGLDDEFSVLKFLSQELQVRANSIRSQRFPTKKAA